MKKIGIVLLGGKIGGLSPFDNKACSVFFIY